MWLAWPRAAAPSCVSRFFGQGDRVYAVYGVTGYRHLVYDVYARPKYNQRLFTGDVRQRPCDASFPTGGDDLQLQPSHSASRPLARFFRFRRYPLSKRARPYLSIRLGVAQVCEISFAFFFGNHFEKRGGCSPQLLNSARLSFCVRTI